MAVTIARVNMETLSRWVCRAMLVVSLLTIWAARLCI